MHASTPAVPSFLSHRPHLRVTALLSACLLALASGCGEDEKPPASDRGVLLVGGTRANNVMKVDEQSGEILGEFIPAGSGGLVAPDALVTGPDGHLYVSSGDTPQTSAVLRYDGKTGQFLGTFASGHGLHRPYGAAFGPDNRLYVSSFLSDQLLRFDASTGAFVDVFATGNGQPGGLNGPNALTFGPDGKLYVSTEGSVAVNGQPTFPGLPSQVLRYDITTRQAEVFIDQPALSPAGAGYISLLGVVFGPDCKSPGGTCDLFVSDFANDIRRYELSTRALKATLSTNYSGTVPTKNNLGSLTFGTQSSLHTVGFDNTTGGKSAGALLRFDGRTNEPHPSAGQTGALFVPPDERLVRPIGILYTRLPE
jgi:DNA-binding beta-propeller fold protein YncE